MGETPNKLICADNLEELKNIPPESVDLIYIDPPFFTHKQYEVVWGDEAEVRSFEDRWEGGIEHYIGWLQPRIEKMHEVLKPTGSIYLHCDWHANAQIRIMLDRVFGAKNFRNEIIWDYSFRLMDLPKFYNRKHDSIYFYSKGADNIFNMPKTEWTREDIVRTRKQEIHRDKNGEEWIWMPGGKGNSKNKKKKISEIIEEGKAISDVWQIPVISSSSKERLGYPTQKPETLLERIIRASSNEGGLVLDAFCGCGTACVVAQRLKRDWIGIDISPTAIKIVEQRLKKLGVSKNKDYVVTGAPTTVRALKNLKPLEFQNWVINEMQAKHSKKKVGDMGIDGFLEKNIFHEAAGIQVKQSESIGRNVVDNFKSALERAKYKKGYIVAFSFGRGAAEEAARLKNRGETEITLVTVEELLFKTAILK